VILIYPSCSNLIEYPLCAQQDGAEKLVLLGCCDFHVVTIKLLGSPLVAVNWEAEVATLVGSSKRCAFECSRNRIDPSILLQLFTKGNMIFRHAKGESLPF
jgi:hypothetical protein